MVFEFRTDGRVNCHILASPGSERQSPPRKSCRFSSSTQAPQVLPLESSPSSSAWLLPRAKRAQHWNCAAGCAHGRPLTQQNIEQLAHKSTKNGKPSNKRQVGVRRSEMTAAHLQSSNPRERHVVISRHRSDRAAPDGGQKQSATCRAPQPACFARHITLRNSVGHAAREASASSVQMRATAAQIADQQQR